MTCKEKHKEITGVDLKDFMDFCPSDFGIMRNPELDMCAHFECEKCWDREVPGDIFETAKKTSEAASKEIEKVSEAINNLSPTIKDSGDRTQFETGAVRDMHDGKGRMDLLPWAAIMEVSKHCENGAKKYGEHNVDKGIPTSSLCDSAARHLAKYLDGWEDEPHLLAAAWNLLWAIQMEIKNKEMVNTPWKKRDNITNMSPE